MFCVNCGSEVRDNHKFCAHYGTPVENDCDFTAQRCHSKGNWPVAIFRDDETDRGYFGYDIATECETDYFDTVEEVVEALYKDINKWLFSVDKQPTEQAVRADEHVREQIEDGFTLIEIRYLSIKYSED